MRIDFDAYLRMRFPSITEVAVEATGDSANLLQVTCAAERDAPPSKVAEQIVHVWINDLCYQFRQAHSLRQTATTVELNFATQTGEGEDDIFVTGTIVVRWPEHEGMSR